MLVTKLAAKLAAKLVAKLAAKLAAMLVAKLAAMLAQPAWAQTLRRWAATWLDPLGALHLAAAI